MVRSVDIEEDLRGVSYSRVNKGFMVKVKRYQIISELMEKYKSGA